jgi:hypothetical protein
MDIAKAVALAIANVRKEGLTDIFPRPYEVDLLNSTLFSAKVASEVEKRIKSNNLQSLGVHPIQHVLYPKKEPFDFRRAALMQPLDTITHLALVLSIADDIERFRPPLKAKQVFSYRLHPKDGYLFNANYHYTAFDSYAQKKTKSGRVNVLVKCDIANFYDRVNLHRLESTLLSLKIDKARVGQINQLMLFWANRDSYGIPIGGNASRILAEAALISVDDFLISNKVAFSRYVDDYRFFAPDTKTAHSWLASFAERLFLEGLSISPSKTVIEDVSKRVSGAKPEESSQAPTREKANTTARMIVGYTGTVPTKFRKLSPREREKLKDEDLAALIAELDKQVVLLPDDIKRMLRVLVAKSAFDELSIMPKILDRFPQFIPLVVDLAIKEAENIPTGTRTVLKNYFNGVILDAERIPEYILISSVQLLGSDGYKSEETILALFRNLKRNAGSYIGRSILDSLLGDANRSQVIEIRQFFNRADAWEKRAIIRLVHQHLPEEEKRPWLKNIKGHLESDLFAVETIEPTKKTK